MTYFAEVILTQTTSIVCRGKNENKDILPIERIRVVQYCLNADVYLKKMQIWKFAFCSLLHVYYTTFANTFITLIVS